MCRAIVELGISSFRPKRHVKIFVASEKEMEARRHYSNHGVELAAEFDAFADSSRICMQFVLPEFMPEHFNRSGSGAIFGRAKPSSALRLNSEHGKEFGCNPRPSREGRARTVEVIVVPNVKRG